MGIAVRRVRILICTMAAMIGVAAANTCLTPNLQEGSCINLLDCRPLLDLLTSPSRTDADTKLLQQSQCGLVGRTVYVCCPTEGGILSRSGPAAPPGDPTSDNGLLPSSRVCGKSFEDRIFGGNRTRIDEYPWAALIEYTKPGNVKGHYCGGALINERYVLTAAHCVTGRGVPSNWRVSGVRLGEWDRRTNPDCEVNVQGEQDCAEEHVDVDIEELVPHPAYDSHAANQLHDIALVRLSRPVAYTDFIRPVCLPLQSELRGKSFEDTLMDVTGWGHTEHGPKSDLKLKASLKVWHLDSCKRRYESKRIHLQPSQMCAGGTEGVDSCGGDSGGPLVVRERIDNRSVYVLAGVVSFGPKPCGLRNWPGVYTRVGAYADWISSTVRA